MLFRKTVWCGAAILLLAAGCKEDPADDGLGSSRNNPRGVDAGEGTPSEAVKPEPDDASSVVSPPAAPPATRPPPVVGTPLPAVMPEPAAGGAAPVEPVVTPSTSADAAAAEVAPEPAAGGAAPLEPEPEPEVDPDWPFDAMNDPIDNPVTCPELEPATGEFCEEDSLVCKYGSELVCRSRWVCSGGQWYLNYGPRDCPESCPAEEPQEGDPCEVDRAVCDFGEDPSCTAQWLCWEGQWAKTFAGDCEVDTLCPEKPPEDGTACDLSEVTPHGGRCIYEGGAMCGCACSWFEGDAPTIAWWCNIVSAEYPPSYLTACPKDVPEPGTPCDTNSTCGYINGDMCTEPYAGSTLANCVDGAWVLSMELPL